MLKRESSDDAWKQQQYMLLFEETQEESYKLAGTYYLLVCVCVCVSELNDCSRSLLSRDLLIRKQKVIGHKINSSET